MIIARKEVKTYNIHAMCECGGEFKPNEDNIFCNLFGFLDDGFEHKCDRCGKVEIFENLYPNEIQEEVGPKINKEVPDKYNFEIGL